MADSRACPPAGSSSSVPATPTPPACLAQPHRTSSAANCPLTPANMTKALPRRILQKPMPVPKDSSGRTTRRRAVKQDGDWDRTGEMLAEQRWTEGGRMHQRDGLRRRRTSRASASSPGGETRRNGRDRRWRSTIADRGCRSSLTKVAGMHGKEAVEGWEVGRHIREMTRIHNRT
ncbi:hypothetical protein GALMADRAFT_217212 [Galerina marginata CBS 339.88]|uniref:Uncharacterized protein n=1 Tax=Galerina marginata (strain CBS 339.88) TaxID=685588 RepID=A0A067SEG1_GALM3|nr:hypothetical protein GALMADRAFT_217212 [Galerina marginata CBS 339.88]